MLAALLALPLSTGLFLTRATGTNGWFGYEVRGRDDKMIMRGAVPPNGEGNPYYDTGAGMTYPDGIVWFKVRMMGRVGDAENIGVSARGFQREKVELPRDQTICQSRSSSILPERS